jgi:hypothetical protein
MKKYKYFISYVAYNSNGEMSVGESVLILPFKIKDGTDIDRIITFLKVENRWKQVVPMNYIRMK